MEPLLSASCSENRPEPSLRAPRPPHRILCFLCYGASAVALHGRIARASNDEVAQFRPKRLCCLTVSGVQTANEGVQFARINLNRGKRPNEADQSAF